MPSKGPRYRRHWVYLPLYKWPRYFLPKYGLISSMALSSCLGNKFFYVDINFSVTLLILRNKKIFVLPSNQGKAIWRLGVKMKKIKKNPKIKQKQKKPGKETKRKKGQTDGKIREGNVKKKRHRRYCKKLRDEWERGESMGARKTYKHKWPRNSIFIVIIQ